MLMQQAKTVNHEMTDESSWNWLSLEQMVLEFANENHGEAGSTKQYNDQCTDETAFFFGA